MADIKVNYGVLKDITDTVYGYKEALGTMKDAIKKIGIAIENGKGDTIDELKDKATEFSTEIAKCEEELDDIYSIVSGYIKDMTSLISPKVYTDMMQVDESDINFNIKSIINACEAVMKLGKKSLSDSCYAATEEEKKRQEDNYRVMTGILGRIKGEYSSKLQAEINKLNKIYNNKIKEYAHMDKAYKSKASDFKNKYTDFWDAVCDFFCDVGEAIWGFVKGVLVAAYNLVEGLVMLAWGIVKFLAACTVYDICNLTNVETPKWANDTVNNTFGTIEAILKDPVVVIESMCQSISDTYEEEGLAYCLGNVTFEVASEILLTKGLGKLGAAGKTADALDNVADVAKVVDTADDVIDVAKVADNFDEIADVANVADNAADAAKDIEKVTDSLDEIADVANISDDTADTAKDIEKVTDSLDDLDDVPDVGGVNKGGSYSNFADGMSATDRARYIQQNETKFFEEFSERARASGLNDTQINEAFDAMKVGDYEKMASYFDTSSPIDGGVFWSGNKEGAAAYANGVGGTIMEQTPGGQVFDNWRGLQGMYPDWDTGTMPQKPIWDAMSSQYANGVTGTATYVHPNGYEGNVWKKIEKPILDENDIIINEVIINATQ